MIDANYLSQPVIVGSMIVQIVHNCSLINEISRIRISDILPDFNIGVKVGVKTVGVKTTGGIWVISGENCVVNNSGGNIFGILPDFITSMYIFPDILNFEKIQ